jgi:hypothetical protein
MRFWFFVYIDVDEIETEKSSESNHTLVPTHFSIMSFLEISN